MRDQDKFDVARFWSRVEVRKAEQCWPWRYGVNDAGYGEFRFEGRGRITQAAPRAAYWLSFGDIPEGMVIRHKCDNPSCCNPDHLEPGSHADNVRDRVERGRSAVGEQSGRAKLNLEIVQHIRDSKLSKKFLANMYEVDERTIDKIKKGETWAHV